MIERSSIYNDKFIKYYEAVREKYKLSGIRNKKIEQYAEIASSRFTYKFDRYMIADIIGTVNVKFGDKIVPCYKIKYCVDGKEDRVLVKDIPPSFLTVVPKSKSVFH